MARGTAQTGDEPPPGTPAAPPGAPLAALASLARYPLLAALRGRRSRRFGPGMAIGEGPFAYASQRAPLPLSEAEAAALAFAAAGITGSALANLAYGPSQGGNMLAATGLVGRTIPSPDAVNIVAAFLTSDAGTFLVRRPQDLPAGELPALIDAAVAATVAYCEYIYRRYGRFPAYVPPFRTVLGYQATHVDADFYDRFYRPEALTETQREHLARWHPAPPGP